MHSQLLYINGQWVNGLGEGTTEVRDPYDDTLVGTTARASETQAHDAVDAASSALQQPLQAQERATILLRTSELITERIEEFAEIIRAEAGKPITTARGEVLRAATTFRLAAEEATRLPSETVNFDAVNGRNPLAFTVAEPVGVVAAITPFNFPLNLVAHKVGPALAAGCAVVLKPSERTPLTAGFLAHVLEDAGLTAGWFNLVTGDPRIISKAWTENPSVAVITFTGSAGVGWKLKASSPSKRHVLELGSNTGLIVAEDADLDRAVDAVVTGGFAFSGQACVSVQRVYVHEDIAEDFTAKLKTAVDALVAGDTRDPQTTVGPLVSKDARERVMSWIDEATERGATIVSGGTLDGTVIRPTVLANVPTDAKVVYEEVFGPVVIIQTIKNLEEGLAQLNSSRYGLNTGIFTRNVDAALKFARQAEAGTVMVNITPSFRSDSMPYGGVKDSGQGREGVKYAIAELLEQKLIVLSN
ncbi:aldehyde dehydrogenase family protein [Paenarthrobacter sp. NPDC089714]|uniref:aldehyde dehydrogenase family protein n=1 Tax=Paenarthrobacter sp. NPDC089714 TaxID=3364377 RepID=UPI003816D4AE